MSDIPEGSTGNNRKASGNSARNWIFLTIAFLVAIWAGLYWHRSAIDTPVQQALVGETGSSVEVYRDSWFGGDNIVFNINSVGGEMSAVDMTRQLLKSAEALKDEEFGKVYLANKGSKKFYLEGAYFKTLGQERGTQNPVYTIRTMPENVYNLDGSHAFQTWSGGLLGVVGQQFEDNNEFHRQWWINDALNSL